MAKKTEYRIELFKDTAGKSRFRLVHINGNVLMISSESYERPSTRTRIANRIAEVNGWDVVKVD